MFIGSVDVGATKKIKKRIARLESLYLTMKKQCSMQLLVEETLSEDSQSFSFEDESEVSIKSYSSEDSNVVTKKYQNTFQYQELSEIMERTGVSNRDACKIVNACLKDLGVACASYVLDPAKFRRQRKHWRKIADKEHDNALSGLRCLGFDGRVDITRSFVNKEGYKHLNL